MRRNKTRCIALCGLLGAVSLVIMLLGSLFPLSTYVCPTLACLLCYIVFKLCGTRLAVVWYFTVSMLVLILGSDKEAALVFLLLGYYPILKPRLDRSPLRIIWKALLFNGAVLVLFIVVTAIMGLDITGELKAASLWLTILLMLLSNIVFFLLDKVLTSLECKTESRRDHG